MKHVTPVLIMCLIFTCAYAFAKCCIVPRLAIPPGTWLYHVSWIGIGTGLGLACFFVQVQVEREICGHPGGKRSGNVDD
jgi:hypothetical protein